MAARKSITVKEPTKREVKDAAKETHKGHSSGGRVLNERKIAKHTKPK